MSTLDAAVMADPNWRDTIVEAFREHRTAVYGIGRRFCGEDAAPDITQEVFMRVWNNPRGYDDRRGNIGQYLCTIARGVAIDHLRRQTSRLLRDTRHAMSAGRTATDDDVSYSVIATETSDRVARALERLQSSERHAIGMAFFDEMSYREVALRLGVAEGTAKSRIRAGLAKLRAELQAELQSEFDASGDAEGAA